MIIVTGSVQVSISASSSPTPRVNNNANAAFACDQSLRDFFKRFDLRPRKFQIDGACGVFKPGEVPRKQKGLAVISPQRFVDAVAEQQAMIENRNLSPLRAA